ILLVGDRRGSAWIRSVSCRAARSGEILAALARRVPAEVSVQPCATQHQDYIDARSNRGLEKQCPKNASKQYVRGRRRRSVRRLPTLPKPATYGSGSLR